MSESAAVTAWISAVGAIISADSETWKLNLAKELKHARFQIDMNKAI
jgi:hypothetical protein